MEKEIIKLVEEKGPLTGSEILNYRNDDELLLWRTCKLSKNLAVQTVGTRYLRLDNRIKGYVRQSPSILREFLTYSVVGLDRDQFSLIKKADRIASHIEDVSKAKSELAYRIVSGLMSRFEHEPNINERVCFIIAGDIVHNMAHDVPRPERSTGRLVNGSDMDLVVVVDNHFPKKLMAMLDEAIYDQKYRLLTTPHLREEIDYVVKNLDRVKEQVRFDTFKHIVACKILHEGTLLYGSEKIFHSVKTLLKANGIIQKLDAMEKRAKAFRREAEEFLLLGNPEKIREESLYLFYPSEESEEFE